MLNLSKTFGLSGKKHAQSLTHKQTGKKLSQNTKCHSERLFCHPERSASISSCHPERSAAESKDLALEHNSTPATSSRHCERSEAISLHHSLFLVRHSIFTTTFTFLLVLFLIASPAQAKYGGGTGEPNDPYLIFDANQMNAIGADSNDWDKHFKLIADIDLSAYTGTSFNIIGTWYNPFTGVFDGNDHTISNFSYTFAGRDYTGLFGYVSDANAEIRYLRLIDPNVDAGTGNIVGSLVGSLREGKITGCYVEGGSISGIYGVGGLVGDNGGTINNCYSTGRVWGDWSVGGLVGLNYDGTITNCYSTGSVSGNHRVGGLAGYNWAGTINNCYASGDVSGGDDVGGLVGLNYDTISNCYSAGSVTGDDNVGGLVGRNWSTVSNSYSVGDVNGVTNVGGLVGKDISGNYTKSFWDSTVNPDVNGIGNTTDANVIGESTANMQMASTFTDAGWDFIGEVINGPNDIWTICEGEDYPRLWWEKYGGGNGTGANPYLIRTSCQMNAIGADSNDWDKHFKLMADIDLSGFTGTAFNIIGTDYDNAFTGIFDGNGHRISNFTYDCNGTHYIGLFGHIRWGAEIEDLGLIDPNVDAGTVWYVGSLMGMNYGTVTNCYAEGGSVSGATNVGGLVGDNSGTISDCYANGSVMGTEDVGGLVGSNGGCDPRWCNSGTISNCYSAGSISGTTNVGGLVGLNPGTISNCFSTGSVSGESTVGGLVGQNGWYECDWVTCWWNSGTIFNCYSSGHVSGTTGVGGLVGYGYGGITFSFWDIETSEQTTSAGGTGKTTAEMQTISTFTDAGWDFVGETFNGIEDIWFIPEGDYPHLWWEGMQVPMKLTPRTLNCRSKGNWVKAHFVLPEGYSVADVDADRPAVLHPFGFESTPLHVSVNENELVEIEAAFEREAVCSLAGDWPEALTVAGFLTDGNIFLGTSKVRMITPGLKDIEELALYWLNADCVQPDFCDGIDMNRDSMVNLLDYALLLNSQVEFIRE